MFSCYGTNRYLCDVLEEMRKCYETRNFSYLPGLIEEAQSLANRMESALADVHDLERLHQKISASEEKLKHLEEKERQLETIEDAVT